MGQNKIITFFDTEIDKANCFSVLEPCSVLIAILLPGLANSYFRFVPQSYATRNRCGCFVVPMGGS